MQYPDYLVHFNKNHSAKNGQFVSGDGDGDGISNDHANQKKTKTVTRAQAKRQLGRGIGFTAGAFGALNLAKAASWIEESAQNATVESAAQGVKFIAAVTAIPLAAVGTVQGIKGTRNMIATRNK